nr:hypothetical protein [Amycolatopsis sp. DSM 110486]
MRHGRDLGVAGRGDPAPHVEEVTDVLDRAAQRLLPGRVDLGPAGGHDQRRAHTVVVGLGLGEAALQELVPVGRGAVERDLRRPLYAGAARGHGLVDHGPIVKGDAHEVPRAQQRDATTAAHVAAVNALVADAAKAAASVR